MHSHLQQYQFSFLPTIWYSWPDCFVTHEINRNLQVATTLQNLRKSHAQETQGREVYRGDWCKIITNLGISWYYPIQVAGMVINLSLENCCYVAQNGGLPTTVTGSEYLDNMWDQRSSVFRPKLYQAAHWRPIFDWIQHFQKGSQNCGLNIWTIAWNLLSCNWPPIKQLSPSYFFIS